MIAIIVVVVVLFSFLVVITIVVATHNAQNKLQMEAGEPTSSISSSLKTIQLFNPLN